MSVPSYVLEMLLIVLEYVIIDGHSLHQCAVSLT